MRVKGMVPAVATAALLSLGLALAAQQPALQVAQAQLGTGVENRQLQGPATSFAAGSKVYLWLEVTGGPSDPITVTWKHGDASHATQLSIGGNPWRTWAYKAAGAAGAWTVTVTGAGGAVLKTLAFTVE